MKHPLLVVALIAARLVVAQDQPHFFTPVAGEDQKLRGSVAASEGAIGLDARKAEAGFKVTMVSPGSPAERSGVKVGDAITAIDGNSLANVGQGGFYRLLAKHPGEVIQLSYVRDGQQAQTAVPVESRLKVYPSESTSTPSITQFLFDGHASLIASVSQVPSQPQSVMVWLGFSNIDAPILTLDDAKFFVLDGTGQQLRHMALDEVKYSIQSWVAQNWHAGNYQAPPPPPPQHHYIITGTQNGNYTFSEMGNMGTLSGNSTSTYNVQEQTDYGQAGWYSLGLALRQRADKKHNNQIMQQAQAALSQWDGLYFKSQSPVIPGENRRGGIMYWSGSSREVAPPFKLVLFLTDPSTSKQEMVKFEFVSNPPAQSAMQYPTPVSSATAFVPANTPPPPPAPSPVVTLATPKSETRVVVVATPAPQASVGAPAPSTAGPKPVAETPSTAPIEAHVVESKLELTITSDPPGAAVEVNGISVGATPLTVALTPGPNCSIGVKKDGFVPWKMAYPTSAAGKFKLNANLTKEVFR